MLAAALTMLAAALATLFLWWLARHSKRRAQILQRADAELEALYRAAQTLVQDDTVPDIISNFAVAYVKRSMDGRLAYWMARDLATGDFLKRRKNGPRKEFRDAVEGLSPVQMEALAAVITYGLMVSAAANFFIGGLLRRVLLFALFDLTKQPETEKPVLRAGNTNAFVIASEFNQDFPRDKSRELEPVAC